MPRIYTPKKIEIVSERGDTTLDEVEKRVNKAYPILFEETIKHLKEKKAMEKQNNSKFQNQPQRGGEQYERRYAH